MCPHPDDVLAAVLLFKILLIQKIIFKIMNIKNFPGDLADISAKSKPLPGCLPSHPFIIRKVDNEKDNNVT